MTDLRSPSRLLAAAVASLALAGCASNEAANGAGDPYENVNRKVSHPALSPLGGEGS